MIMIIRYVRSHHLHGLNRTPHYTHLGHPINAYHLIRHVASGWDKVSRQKLEINHWIRKNVGRMIWSNSFGDIGKRIHNYSQL